MRNAVWLVIGITIGFFAAHQVEKSPQGRQFLDEVDAYPPSADEVQVGEGVVGLRLEPGQVPALRLTPGTTVSVLLTPPSAMALS